MPLESVTGGRRVDDARRDRFEKVVARVYEPLQRYLARRAPADDVGELLDDTLLVLWRRLDDVPTDDPLPWSYGVAKRCLANRRRSHRRQLHLIGRATAESRANRGLAVDATTDAEVALSRALDALSEFDREIVRLWAWEQLEPREIAIVLDTTPNAISVRLARVRTKLREHIGRQNDDASGQRVIGHRKEDGT